MKAGQVVSVSFWPVPNLGGSQKDSQAYGTLIQQMRLLAKAVKATKPQTVVVFSRYQYMLPDAVGYSPQPRLRGELTVDNDTMASLGIETDSILLNRIISKSRLFGVPLMNILEQMPTLSVSDYLLHPTALIPLYFLKEAGIGAKQIVRLTVGRISYEDLYTLGCVLVSASQDTSRRVAIIGAGNLLPTRTINREDVSIEQNALLMQALADKELSYLQEIGYQSADEYVGRVAALLIGAASQSRADLTMHMYTEIENQRMGLLHYVTKENK